MLREKPAGRPDQDEEEEEPTPPPTLSDSEKTHRKPYPKKEGSKGGE
jgi:hypothetical protein